MITLSSHKKTPLLILGLLGLVTLIQLVPFYLGLVTSFKDSRDQGSVWALPLSEPTLENFSTAWERGSMGYALMNSAIVTVATTVLVVIVGSLAAYPLARRRTRFNGFILVATLAVMMIPPLSILVPLIRLLKSLNLLNTHIGLILPLAAFALPQAIFLYSQSLRGIPESMEEAAKIDGAGSLRTFFSVVLPMLTPVTISVVILTGTAVWNEFALSSYIMTTNETRTLAPAIASFFGAAGANVNAAIASSFLGIIPVLVVYVFLQRYFMKGMLAGAVK
ncbi:MAG: carbohydrate ABC transporter permease [Actinomycetaceae bacterium]|nr:carbohydrate ABC transporter permease [Actinomycetaceae bacterium]